MALQVEGVLRRVALERDLGMQQLHLRPFLPELVNSLHEQSLLFTVRDSNMKVVALT